MSIKKEFFQPGDQVCHEKYGNGIVIQVLLTEVLVNCKTSNRLEKLKISELTKVKI